MNILFLDQFSELGGAQRCLLDLLPAIESRGWHLHAALPGDGPLVDLLGSRNVGVNSIPCGPYRSGSKSAADFLRFPLDAWRQAGVIRRLLDREAFDLVYVNGARVLPAAALASRGRVPVLFHVHFPIHGYAARLAGLYTRRANATVAACCRFVAKPFHRYVGPDRLRVIANGTADAGFRERSFGAGGRWRIGVIGRIAPEKGQKEFLRAAALLACDYQPSRLFSTSAGSRKNRGAAVRWSDTPSHRLFNPAPPGAGLVPVFPGLRFVICGAPFWAARNYFDEVRTMAHGLPVDFLEWQDDVASVLANLDLLVIPSAQEGMPRILLEAFSAGLPVVAFPASGIPEVIEDGVTGFLVPQSSPAALASRIRDLITGDLARLMRVARSARDEWERRYTVETYRNEIIAVIEDLTSNRQTERETATLQPRR